MIHPQTHCHCFVSRAHFNPLRSTRCLLKSVRRGHCHHNNRCGGSQRERGPPGPTACHLRGDLKRGARAAPRDGTRSPISIVPLSLQEVLSHRPWKPRAAGTNVLGPWSSGLPEASLARTQPTRTPCPLTDRLTTALQRLCVHSGRKPAGRCPAWLWCWGGGGRLGLTVVSPSLVHLQVRGTLPAARRVS